MGDYIYSNDYEREETQKYEGTYTPEEVELNKKLYAECYKNPIDFNAVEELLKQGADPLGATALYGWGLFENVYLDFVGDSQENNSIDLPKITELFLKYGMDVDNPRIPYDVDNNLNPMWEFSFVTNENAVFALKMLLDKGLSADGFSEFYSHSLFDFYNIECGDPQNDEFWNYTCTWALKMILLGASYDHILDNDEDLRESICLEYNNYDIHKFRDWDRFEYYFDTSHCERRPELYGSIVHIYEKDTGDEVWTIGMGLAGRKILEKAEESKNSNIPKEE